MFNVVHELTLVVNEQQNEWWGVYVVAGQLWAFKRVSIETWLKFILQQNSSNPFDGMVCIDASINAA